MENTAPGDRVSLELRDYLRVIRRRWRMLAIVTLVIAGAIFGYTQTRPAQYEATSQVLLDAGYSRTIIYADSTVIPDLDAQATTELDLMRSPTIQEEIAETLGYEPEVSISAVRPPRDDAKTRAIAVVGLASSGEVAARYANDYAKTFVTIRKRLITEDLKATMAQNKESLNALDEQAAAADQEIERIQESIRDMPPGQERQVLENRLKRLEYARSTSSIAQRQTEINSRNDRLQDALAANQRERGIFRVGTAEEPSAPVSPIPRRDLMVALAIGLAIGLCCIFLRDYYDDTLRTKEDLDRVTNGIPVLSMVPQTEGGENTQIESLARPRSPAAESYRNLRTSIEFASLNHKISLIHITSSLPGEGKTTTAVNLAVAMANAQKRVVLVDCDLRRPRVHEYFGMDNDQGFTSVLLGNCSLQDALQRPADVPSILVLTSGPPPPNPSELLSSRSVKELLTTLSEPADVVIVDSPPLLPVSDSVILAGFAHSTLLVVAARSTSRRSLGRSLEMLSQIDAPLEGVVFNRIGVEATYGDGYGYGYGNYVETPPNKFFKRRS